MSGKLKSIVAFPAATLAILALAACGGETGGDAEAGGETAAGAGGDAASAPAKKLFANDFKGVCSGATVSAATAYDAEGGNHKALLFETYEEDLIDRSSSLPDDWTVRFSADEDMYKQIDLVLCAKRTKAEKVKVCDGYKNDGKEMENKVNWHTATYDLSVVEATTGKTLAESSVEATDNSCPMFQSFESPTEVVDGYARPTESQINDFLKPHMGK